MTLPADPRRAAGAAVCADALHRVMGRVPEPWFAGTAASVKSCRGVRLCGGLPGCRFRQHGLVQILLDSHFAAIVAAFATNRVVNVPCAAIGADCECRDQSLVVCTTFCRAGMRLSAFRMCHFYLAFNCYFCSFILLREAACAPHGGAGADPYILIMCGARRACASILLFSAQETGPSSSCIGSSSSPSAPRLRRHSAISGLQRPGAWRLCSGMQSISVV